MTADPRGAAERTHGVAPGCGWHYVAVEGPDPLLPTVRGDDGRWLCREPHGFPGIVEVHGHPGGEAPRLRLAKAAALASASLGRSGPVVIEILPAGTAPTPGRSPDVSWEGGEERLRIPGGWADEYGHTAASLRRALMEALGRNPRDGEGGEGHRIEDSTSSAGKASAQVLLFRNVFTKDVDRGDARQVNPGAHHLISALRADGHQVVLLDAKHPLQDVCSRPPDVHQSLDADDVLTDRDELLSALREHPDLNLVCLTVLERSFAQARELCCWIRDHSEAFVAVGGPLPTASPEHCLAHLPGVDLVVRGDGEEVLPRIARALAGRTRTTGLDPAAWRALRGLEGLAARDDHTLLCAHLDRVNRVADLDDSPLDFGFLEREHVRAGLSLTTSRGCVYACRFCSVHDRQLWRAMSPSRVLSHLAAYRERLDEIYGAGEAPAEAMQLQLWDDDFFVDPLRAAALLEGIAAAGHRIAFLQGTVASFFLREGRRITQQLDEGLIDAIRAYAFAATGGLKLGTESFCDRELRRLGKPYRVARIRELVEALARRGIRQDHYQVLCNRETSLEDLLTGLENITELRLLAGEGFSVLQPSWLIHLFPTALYRSAQRRGREGELPTCGALSIAGHPEFDYPFVLPERPRRPEVFEVVRRFPAGMHFGAAGDPQETFGEVYGDGDPGYLEVFGAIRRVLAARLTHLADRHGADRAAERLRIRRILDGRLGEVIEVPRGVVLRLAPGLVPRPAPTDAGDLGGYLEGLLRSAAEEGDWRFGHRWTESSAGVELTVNMGEGPVELLVQPFDDLLPCAAHTRNLALVVRSPMDSDAARDRAGRAVEALIGAIGDRDRGELA